MRKDGISAETDALASDLFGQAFDLLAEEAFSGVLLVAETQKGETLSFEFSDDAIDVLLEGAYAKVKEIAKQEDPALRYALAYVGAIEDEQDNFSDALLVEFGESGYKAYSAYSYIENIAGHDQFAWTEPAPAGEVEALI